MKIEKNDMSFDTNRGWAMVNGIIFDNITYVYVGLGDVSIGRTNEKGEDYPCCRIPIDNVNKFWVSDTDEYGSAINETEISQWIIEENDKYAQAFVKTLAKEKTQKVAQEIIDNIDIDIDYIYSWYDDSNSNISSVNNLNGYDEKYVYMLEHFSDLVDEDEYKNQSAFNGFTDEYFDAVQKIRDFEKKTARENKEKYKEYKDEETLSRWNVGCQYGMAMYIWIPYQ